MKRYFSFILCIILLFTCCIFQVSATDEKETPPYVIDFSLSSQVDEDININNVTRDADLIMYYQLSLSKTGTKLLISGATSCVTSVVKSGFKNLMVQRRKSSSSSWSDYFDFGNVYYDSSSANLSTNVLVASGYQYRVTCKHYAKKSLLSTETISNTSNTVTV